MSFFIFFSTILYTLLSFGQEKLFVTTVEKVEKRPQYFLKRANQYWKLNELNNAKNVLDSAIGLFPNDAELLANCALSYIYFNDANGKKKDVYSNAHEKAEKSVKMGPSMSITYIARLIATANLFAFVDIFQSVDFIFKTRNDFEKAITLNNASKDMLSVAYIVFAIIVIEASKVSPIFRFPLGLSWTTSEYSVSLFKKGLTLSPNSIFAFFEYAKALFFLKEFEEAKLYVQKAIVYPETYPNDSLRKSEAKELLKSINSEMNK